jgi:hypothetical protein
VKEEIVQQSKRAAEGVRQTAHRSAREAQPWLIWFGRCGYAAEGIVYALVGVLAVKVALGHGGETTDNKGALVQIVQAPFGRLLLILVALGIIGFACWRFLQAVLDTDNKGAHARGIVQRLAYAGIGVVHIGLALSALRLLRTGNAGASSSASAQDWTAKLLSKPYGQWLVALVGLIVIGVGCFQFYRSYTAKFREELALPAMSATEDRWVTWLGRAGYAAQGVVFWIIGLFLGYAGLRANPGEARGLDGALTTLAQQPFGPWLLSLVAVGLVAYGLYLCAQARYRRMVIT